MTDTTIEQFLREAPASREAQYAELFATLQRASDQRTLAFDGDEAEVSIDDAERAIDESVADVSRMWQFEVTISGGGPAEWLEAYCDEDGELLRVDFAAAWWGPASRTTVEEGSALWRLAERMNPWQS